MYTKSIFSNNNFIKKKSLKSIFYTHFKLLSIPIKIINRSSPLSKPILLCLITLITFSVNHLAAKEEDVPFRWGAAYDFMAPRIGGLSSVNLDASLSYGQFKHTLFFAHININDDHLTDESFCKDNLNGFGYRFEIFSHKETKNWSAGLLLMYSMHDVTTVHNKQEGSFNTIMVGVPLGYTWVLWDRVTINPNISILVPITNRTVTIGSDKEKQAPWGLEPGIRIGYRF